MRPYVIFTQLTKDSPHRCAGWVDAYDDEMAIEFACEHYGQDQACVNIWSIPREAIAGTDDDYPVSDEAGPERIFEVFAQSERGDLHISSGFVTATSSADALKQSLDRTGGSDPFSIWVVERERIRATEDDALIWRYTDQTYRLARGYSKQVREKWERIRRDRDIKEYEKEDLKEMF